MQEESFNLKYGLAPREEDSPQKERLLNTTASNTSSQPSHLSPSKVRDDKPVYWREGWQKWPALFVMCMTLIGVCVSTEFPSYLQPQIEKDMFGYDQSKAEDADKATEAKIKYNLFFLCYTFPSSFLPVFGGYFIDTFGVRKALVILTLLCFLGQILCAFSGTFAGGQDNWDTTTAYAWMIAGRVVFSMGGSSMWIAQGAVISKWFKGKLLAFAMACRLSTGRLGSVLAASFFPVIYEHMKNPNLFLPLLVTVVVTGFSFLNAIAIVFIDRKADAQEGKLILGDEASTPQTKRKPSLHVVKEFPPLYWALAFNSAINFTAYFSAMSITGDLLYYEFDVTRDSVGFYLSIPFLLAIVLCPISGYVSDKIGHRQWFMFIGTVLLLAAHATWLLLKQCDESSKKTHTCHNPYIPIPLCLMGLSYSLFGTTIYPCLSLILADTQVGMGFGIANALSNMIPMLITVPLAVIQGETQEKNGGYFWSEIMFLTLCIISMAFAVMTVVQNKKMDNVLGRKDKPKQKLLLIAAKNSSFMQ